MLYRGGFVIFARQAPPTAPTEELAALLEGWTERRIGQYAVRFDETWTCSYAAAGDRAVLLLGIAMDVERPETAQEGVVAQLAAAPSLFDALDALCGAHVIVVRDGARHFVVQDATGMERVASDEALVASHEALIAELRGHVPGEFGRCMEGRPELPHGPSYFPGLRTRYDEVRRLTPNTLLDLDTRAVERFFPRRPVGERGIGEIVATVAPRLRDQWRWLLDRGPVTVSLTGGVDAGLTLATTREAAPRLHFHTYWSSLRRSLVVDRDVAEALAGRLRLRHVTVPLDTASPPPAFAEVTTRMYGARGTRRWALLAGALHEHLPRDHLHVRSNTLEIARGRTSPQFRATPPDVFTPATLSRAFNPATADEFAPYFEEFCEVTGFDADAKLDIHHSDLFYWEHRMGVWHSGVVQIHKLTHPSHVLYNCRRLLTAMLARPLEERVTGSVVSALAEELWPEVARR